MYTIFVNTTPRVFVRLQDLASKYILFYLFAFIIHLSFMAKKKTFAVKQQIALSAEFHVIIPLNFYNITQMKEKPKINKIQILSVKLTDRLTEYFIVYFGCLYYNE